MYSLVRTYPRYKRRLSGSMNNAKRVETVVIATLKARSPLKKEVYTLLRKTFVRTVKDNDDTDNNLILSALDCMRQTLTDRIAKQ